MTSTGSSASSEHGWCRACTALLARMKDGSLPAHERPGSRIPCINDGILVPVSPGFASNSTDQAVRDLWGYGPVTWDRIMERTRENIISATAVPPHQMDRTHDISHPGSITRTHSSGTWLAPAGGGGGSSLNHVHGWGGSERDRAVAAAADYGPVPEAPQVPDEPYVIHRAAFTDTGDRKELEAMLAAYAAAWPRDPRPREEIDHEARQTALPVHRAAAPEPEYRWSGHRIAWAVLLVLAVVNAVMTSLLPEFWPW